MIQGLCMLSNNSFIYTQASRWRILACYLETHAKVSTIKNEKIKYTIPEARLNNIKIEMLKLSD